MMIYHYTSIQTLALILESQKIRFNRLDRVDDIQESSLFNKRVIEQFIFVSCWTKIETENITLWKMYTDYKGVRIGLPDKPWINTPVKKEEWSDTNIIINETFKTPFAKDEYIGNNHFIMPSFLYDPQNNEPIFIDLEYKTLSELKDVYSDVYQERKYSFSGFKLGDIVSIPFEKIARFKHERWGIQKESRFILIVFPKLKSDDFSEEKTMERIIFRHVKNEMPSELYFFDVKIDDNNIKNIEIMLGPLCSKADELLVNALIAKYGLIQPLKMSEIQIRK